MTIPTKKTGNNFSANSSPKAKIKVIINPVIASNKIEKNLINIYHSSIFKSQHT